MNFEPIWSLLQCVELLRWFINCMLIGCAILKFLMCLNLFSVLVLYSFWELLIDRFYDSCYLFVVVQDGFLFEEWVVDLFMWFVGGGVECEKLIVLFVYFV